MGALVGAKMLKERVVASHRVAGATTAALLFLFGVTLAAEAHASGFDFAVERFEVTGSGAFVDEFDDGRTDVPPTSRLVERGLTRVSETGGRLVLSSTDGSDAFYNTALRADIVFSNRPIVAGPMGSLVEATFRPDLPSGLGAGYGILLGTQPASGALIGTAIVGLYRSEDAARVLPVPVACNVPGSWIVTFQRDPFSLSACDVVAPASVTGPVVFRLWIGSAPASTLAASYSVDGGTTFRLSGAWTIPSSQDAAAPERAYPGVFGQGLVDTGFAGLVPGEGAGAAPIAALSGEVRRLAYLTDMPDASTPADGRFSLASAGGDLRAHPETLAIAIDGDVLEAHASAVRTARRVDPLTGRPLAPDAPPDATCTTGAEPHCMQLSSGSIADEAAFDAICETTRGFSSIDRNACAQNLLTSTKLILPGMSVAQLFSQFFAGSPSGIVTAANPVFLGNNASASRLPLVSPSIDQADTAPFGSGFFANPGLVGSTAFGNPGFPVNHNNKQTLAQVTSPQQQALLGCGPFYGTPCDGAAASASAVPDFAASIPGGIDLLNADASALVQSWIGFDGSPLQGSVATDHARVQPGPVCARALPAGGQAILPGCRGPDDPGYDPSVDGADPRVSGIGFPFARSGVPAQGSAVLGAIQFSNGQPFTGDAWPSELAALSWNLEMVLVAFSTQTGSDPALLFNPANAYRTDGCSYVMPQFCSGVRALMLATNTALADDPFGAPRMRWLWETGAEYAITKATGRFAQYTGGTIHAFGPGVSPVPGFAAYVPLMPVAAPLLDADADGIRDDADRCPQVADPGQEDRDDDHAGDACDDCLDVANADQRDSNGDGFGNRCDADLNDDGIVNFADLARMKQAFFSTDADADLNGDGVVNFIDLARLKAAFFKTPGPSASKP